MSNSSLSSSQESSTISGSSSTPNNNYLPSSDSNSSHPSSLTNQPSLTTSNQNPSVSSSHHHHHDGHDNHDTLSNLLNPASGGSSDPSNHVDNVSSQTTSTGSLNRIINNFRIRLPGSSSSSFSITSSITSPNVTTHNNVATTITTAPPLISNSHGNQDPPTLGQSSLPQSQTQQQHHHHHNHNHSESAIATDFPSASASSTATAVSTGIELSRRRRRRTSSDDSSSSSSFVPKRRTRFSSLGFRNKLSQVRSILNGVSSGSSSDHSSSSAQASGSGLVSTAASASASPFAFSSSSGAHINNNSSSISDNGLSGILNQRNNTSTNITPTPPSTHSHHPLSNAPASQRISNSISSLLNAPISNPSQNSSSQSFNSTFTSEESSVAASVASAAASVASVASFASDAPLPLPLASSSSASSSTSSFASASSSDPLFRISLTPATATATTNSSTPSNSESNATSNQPSFSSASSRLRGILNMHPNGINNPTGSSSGDGNANRSLPAHMGSSQRQSRFFPSSSLSSLSNASSLFSSTPPNTTPGTSTLTHRRQSMLASRFGTTPSLLSRSRTLSNASNSSTTSAANSISNGAGSDDNSPLASSTPLLSSSTPTSSLNTSNASSRPGGRDFSVENQASVLARLLVIAATATATSLISDQREGSGNRATRPGLGSSLLENQLGFFGPQPPPSTSTTAATTSNPLSSGSTTSSTSTSTNLPSSIGQPAASGVGSNSPNTPSGTGPGARRVGSEIDNFLSELSNGGLADELQTSLHNANRSNPRRAMNFVRVFQFSSNEQRSGSGVNMVPVLIVGVRSADQNGEGNTPGGASRTSTSSRPDSTPQEGVRSSNSGSSLTAGSSQASRNSSSSSIPSQANSSGGSTEGLSFMDFLNRRLSNRNSSTTDNSSPSSESGHPSRTESSAPLSNEEQDGGNSGTSSAGARSEPPSSETTGHSWVVYVFGGTYPENHPILLRPSVLNENASYEDLLDLEALMGQVKPPVATEEEIESAGGIFKVGQLGEDGCIVTEVEGRCLICLSDFEQGEECRQLQLCSHSFHKLCIDEWLTTGRNSCPMCRAEGVKKMESRSNPTGNGVDPSVTETAAPPWS